MPDPFRLRVLKALSARLKTITPANGYQNDLSDFVDEGGTTRSSVYRGREDFGDERLPMVSILEHPASLDEVNDPPGGAPVAQPNYRLLIQGFVEDDPDNPTDPAHVLAAEVVRVLALAAQERFDLLGLGGDEPCVQKILIGSPVVRPALQGVSTQAFFYLAVTLHLVEDLDNPFT